jgi:hypothetical protein
MKEKNKGIKKQKSKKRQRQSIAITIKNFGVYIFSAGYKIIF